MAIKLLQRAWRRQSIFGAVAAAKLHVDVSATLSPILARFPCRFRSIFSPRLPSSAQTVVVLHSELVLWKTLTALLILDLPERLYHSHPSCQHPAEGPYTATSACWHSPRQLTNIHPASSRRRTACSCVARNHSYPPAWTVCAWDLQQMNLFQRYGV